MSKEKDKNIIERIKELSHTFTEKQRILASFIINNSKEVAFLNSVQLAELSQVSNPSVIRFSALLGYKSYPEMQQDLQALILQELSTVDRISLLTNDTYKNNLSDDNEFLSIYYQEIENIKNCIKLLNLNDMKLATDLLYNASEVYIVGFQASHFLANYSQFALSKIKERVYQFHDWDRNTYNALNLIPENSVALIIGMPRYPNKTLKFIQELYKRKVQVILITDSFMFPYCDLAEVVFTFPVKYFSYVDPLSSLLCFINSLFVEVAKKNEKRSKESLQNYENYISENNVFFKR